MDVASDKIAIMDQMARICRIVDAFAFDRFGEVYADDIAWDYGDGKVINGLENLKSFSAEALIGNLNQACMMHSVSNIVTTVTSDRAESTANCHAAHQGAGAFSGQTLFAWISYNDFWARADETWRITRRVYRTQFSHGPREILYRS